MLWPFTLRFMKNISREAAFFKLAMDTINSVGACNNKTITAFIDNYKKTVKKHYPGGCPATSMCHKENRA